MSAQKKRAVNYSKAAVQRQETAFLGNISGQKKKNLQVRAAAIA